MKKLGYAAAVLILGYASLAFTQEDPNTNSPVPGVAGEPGAPAPRPDVTAEPVAPDSDRGAGAESAAPDPAPSIAVDPGAEPGAPAEEIEAVGAPTGEAPAEAAPAATPSAEAELTEPVSPGASPAAAAPAVETVETMETINATDGESGFKQVGESGIDTDLAAAVETDEEEEEVKPFGFYVGVSHGIGSGTFIKSNCPGTGAQPINDPAAELAAGHSCIGNRTANVSQSWDIRPKINFELLGHKLTIMARWLIDFEFTTPDSPAPQQVTPYDLSFYLIDPEVYKEPFTDITFNGTFRLFVPTSRESINVTSMIMGLQLYAGASRSIGPVDLGYTFGLRKNFNAHPVTKNVGATRMSDYGQAHGIEMQIPKGVPNTEWQVSNTFEVIWHPIEELSVGYSLLIYSNIKYNTHNTRDEWDAPLAQLGWQNGADYFWPTWEVAYNLTQGLSDTVDLPLDLSVALGATALHPVQGMNNEGFIAPVVFNTYSADKAPHNYSTIYLDLIGSY